MQAGPTAVLLPSSSKHFVNIHYAGKSMIRNRVLEIINYESLGSQIIKCLIFASTAESQGIQRTIVDVNDHTINEQIHKMLKADLAERRPT